LHGTRFAAKFLSNPMVRLIPSLLLTATLTVSAGLFGAEASPPPVDPNALPAILANTPAPKTLSMEAPTRPRAISTDVARMLSSNMPKFVPQSARPAETKADDATSQFENDQPRNGIIRLPKMVVREPRPVIFTERAIHTKKGLAELAFKRYISEADRALNRFTLPLFGISAEARALQMYAEDERLRNMADLSDAARIVNLTDTDAGVYLQRAAQQTYMRTNDFGWNGGRSK
jgi:hypothetical protein